MEAPNETSSWSTIGYSRRPGRSPEAPNERVARVRLVDGEEGNDAWAKQFLWPVSNTVSYPSR